MIHVPTNRITTHPGALLLEQLREMGLSVNGVARDIHFPATRLHEIVHERRSVTAGTAIALGAYFGQPHEFWMNAQAAYERRWCMNRLDPSGELRAGFGEA